MGKLHDRMQAGLLLKTYSPHTQRHTYAAPASSPATTSVTCPPKDFLNSAARDRELR
jgi:hypothetical protein